MLNIQKFMFLNFCLYRAWVDMGKTEDLKMVADKLQEGNKYFFRVAAENQYGVSDWVEIPEPTTAKNPYGMYIGTLHGNCS